MRIIYSKMSSERNLKYRILTMIAEKTDGTRQVFKRAMTVDAVPHIKHIKENEIILSKIYGEKHIASCKYVEKDMLSFTYIEGKSLLELIQQALDSNDYKVFNYWIDFYEREILRGAECTITCQIDINPSSRSENLDLLFDNIIITDEGGWKIIDYEWLTTGISKDFLRMRAFSGMLTRISRNREQLVQWLLNIYPDVLQQINSTEYLTIEQSFLKAVLLFPHDRYKRPLYTLNGLLEKSCQKITEKYDAQLVKIRKECEESLNKRDNKIKECEESLNKRDNKISFLQNHIEEIESSRGYRLVKQYYHVRDSFLPRGSVRRLFAKNLVWILLHPQKGTSLCTYENLHKCLNAWRYGGISQLVSRVDCKLHSESVKKLMTVSDEEISTHNLWLEGKKDIYIPKGSIIDIIVPVYNAIVFTQKCLESVLKNTDIDYRLIIIDDCSPDPAVAAYFEKLRKIKATGHLKEMIVLVNEKNLGFLGTVNRAFKLAKHHVVLLNTDTEVPPQWLSRLIWPFFTGKKIATVTPFSNSAEICSFPKFVQNNDLPEGVDVASLDKVFQHYGEQTYVEIPTGVGFAMAVNYNCLQEIGGFDLAFGKGYGEENDFCRRAVSKGWKNVHVRNLFIYHKHGVSFATRKDESKAQRLAKNIAVLNQRYPGYDRLIQEYIEKDPCHAQRIFLLAVVRALQGRTTGKHGILFLNHSLGGGTQSYQDAQIKKRSIEERIYSATVLADGRTFVVYEHISNDEIKGKEIARFDYRMMKKEEYKNLLSALAIDEIFFNHLLGFRLPEFLFWNEECGVSYKVFLHDFYCVCPHYTLINDKGVYCCAEKDQKVCSACLKNEILAVSKDIYDWRMMMKKFLLNATFIMTPSQSTADIILGYYPQLQIKVREHELSCLLHKTYQKDFIKDKLKTIAVLGAIGPAKGVDIVYELKDIIEKNNASVRLVVIGYTSRQNKAYQAPSGKFEITGPYDSAKISDLLAKQRVCLVLIPSIWPETFSYTTGEAIASGYPIIVFNLGAPAERVRRENAGIVVSEISADAMWKAISQKLNL